MRTSNAWFCAAVVATLAAGPVLPAQKLGQKVQSKEQAQKVMAATPKDGRLARLQQNGIVPNLLSAAQYERLKNRPEALQGAIRLAVMGQQLSVGAAETAAAVDSYAANPTPAAMSAAGRALAVKGLGLPQNAANNRLTPSGLMTLVATFQALGDKEGATYSVHDAKTWEAVRTRGSQAVLADKIRENFNIPAKETAGLTPRQLLAGLAGAQRGGKASSDGSYWKSYASQAKKGGSGGSGGNSNSGAQGSRGGSPPRSDMPDRPSTGHSGGSSATGGSSSTGASGQLGSGGPLQGGSAPPAGGGYTVTVTGKETREDGSVRVTFTVTNPDGSTESRSAIVETDGSSTVFDSEGDVIDWYGPGENSVENLNPGTSYSMGSGEHQTATDANQSGGGSASSNSGNSDSGNSSSSDNESSGDDNEDGDDGDDDGDGNDDGNEGEETETADAEGEEAESEDAEGDDASTNPNPMADDTWNGPPLWMMVPAKMGHQEKSRQEKLIGVKSGGGVSRPSSEGAEARKAAMVVMSYQDAQLIMKAIEGGLGGGHTDPAENAEQAGRDANPRMVDRVRTGEAVDRPVRGNPNRGNIPVQPGEIGPRPGR